VHTHWGRLLSLAASRSQPVVHRKNITGVLTGTRVVLWNLEKKK